MKVTRQDGRTEQFNVGASLIGLRIIAVTLEAEDFKNLDTLLDSIKYTIATRIVTPDSGRQKELLMSETTDADAPNIHIHLDGDMPYGMENWLNFEKMNVHIHVTAPISKATLIRLQERLETAVANPSEFHQSCARHHPLPPPTLS